jgi:hypothetical protein
MPADTLPGSRLLRAALMLCGLASLTAGLLLIPAAPGSLAAASSGGAHGSGSAVTVRGPRMWDPKTMKSSGYGKQFSYRSTVTVSQTTNLVYQAVEVSWTGFTPTNFNGYQGFNADETLYPVMIAECKGAHPTNPDQCYGATNGGTPTYYGPYGPQTSVFGTTNPSGAGDAVMDIETISQNNWLGCDSSHPCSLVIMPAQGGNLQAGNPGGSPPWGCANHLYDGNSADLATAVADFDPLSGSDAPCSWADSIIVPLKFAPTTSTCPASSPRLTVIGSPMLATAMNRWDTGLCEGAHPIAVTDLGDVAESEAITQVLQEGLGDVALTTLPSTVGTTSGTRTYTYAPVAVSAAAIGYWADNPTNGYPQTGMRLTPRLVAKVLTMSYNLGNIACQPGQNPRSTHCDPKINRNNPYDIFRDADFQALNPSVSEPASASELSDTPIVLQGNSDMTYELTRWIAASPAAEAFLHGTAAPGGMTVNGYYKDITYPASAFATSDPTTYLADAYAPVASLPNVAKDLVQSTAAGYQYDPNCPPESTSCSQETAFGAEQQGQRALFSVLDTGDTAGFDVPVAALRNGAGRYVEPTAASMAAALNSMVTSKNGITQQVDLSSNNPAAYPLTMVIYAMVPTGGVPKAKADLIAQWLRYVAGPGQTPGELPGQLPPGYLPLPTRLRSETLAAATAVQRQAGNPGTSTPTPAASATLSPSPTGKLPSTSPSPTISLPHVSPRLTTAAVRDPLGAGITRYALPALLILGSLAALGGAASLTVGSPGAATTLARLRRIQQAGIKRRRTP